MLKKIFFTIIALSSAVIYAQTNWVNKNLFEHKNFIENKGQFDNINLPNKEPINYAARIDGVQYFFTKTGYTISRKDKLNGKDKKSSLAIEEKFHEFKFENANADVEIVSENKVPNYYSFSDLKSSDGKGNIIASAFTKIIYKNLYPFTDVVFEFPKDSNGIEYSIILHPGADVEKVKISFAGDANFKLVNDNIEIETSFGKITDHQPTSFTEDRATFIKSNFIVKGNTVGFELEKKYKNKTVIIDPWTVTPTFPGNNDAYDIDYDSQDNVYVYGGEPPFTLEKYDVNGALVWSFVPLVFNSDFYGDFKVDRTFGSIYMVGGAEWAVSTGAKVLKINFNAGFVCQFNGNPAINEFWRIGFHSYPCPPNHYQVVVLGGGNQSATFNTCYLDTGLLGLTIVPFVYPGVDTCHNASAMDISSSGEVTILTNNTKGDSLHHGSLLVAETLPTLLPVNYAVSSDYKINELSSITYEGYANGYNGIDVYQGDINTFDGYVYKQWSVGSGTLTNYKRMRYPAFSDSSLIRWAGVCHDYCGNIFVADSNVIRYYDKTNLQLAFTDVMPGVITDLKFGNNRELYVCGLGFAKNYFPDTVLACCCTSECPGGMGDLKAGADIIDATCTSLGSATVTPYGGSPPFTFSWNTAPPNYTPTITNMPPGTYICTVRGANPCVADMVTVVILGPTALSTNVTTSSLNCGAGISSGTVTASNGTSPYTYIWTGNSGVVHTDNNISIPSVVTGLATGTYTVNITDATGCIGIAYVDITNSVAPVLSVISTTDIECNMMLGEGVVSVTGASPFDFVWTNSSGTIVHTYNNDVSPNTGDSLMAGTYTVTVTDNNGCATSIPVNIIAHPPVSLSVSSITNATCGNNNGSATVVASGGTGGYDYYYIPLNANSNTISNLPGGSSYIAYVMDGIGCTDSVSFTIGNAGILTSVQTQTNVSCNGFSNGSATISTTGAVGPVSYSWSGGGGSNAAATNLSAGTYTVTVTNGTCVNTTLVTITEPAPIVPAVTVAPFDCQNNYGNAIAHPTGGTFPYTFSWTGGQTNQTATGLPTGNYTCVVTDANGCTANQTVTITSNNPDTLSVISTPTTCGTSIGTATASATGGLLPYTYIWSTGQTVPAIGSLGIGTYTLTLTDANGCTQSQTATITDNNSVVLSLSSTPISCSATAGTATATATGGAMPYTYNWTGGQTTPTVTGLGLGTDTCIVTDNNGCEQTQTVAIISTNTITLSLSSTPSGCTANSGSATATPSGGASPYTYSWTGGQTTQTATGLGIGTYTCTTTDNAGCVQTQTVNVTSTNPMTISLSATQPSCTSSNGTATATVSGGILPYTYSWTGGQTTQTATGLGAGSYTCTITDNNGCAQSQSITITSNNQITLTITSTPSGCTINNGTATATVSGGVMPYTYSWTGGQTTQTATGLGIGTYNCTVTDNNGCTHSQSVTVNPTNPMAFTFTSTPSGCTVNNGTATATVSGGTPPFTYSWNNGQTTQTATGLGIGAHTCTVTDNNGCTHTQTVTILSNSPITISLTSTIVGCTVNNGTATATPSGGVPPYTYSWTGGQTTQTATGLALGTYTCTVTDNVGCTHSQPVNVISNSTVLTTSGNSTPSICTANNGTATVLPSGGALPYTYNWTGGQSTQTATGLAPGTYTCIVTDNNGCTHSQSVIVTLFNTIISCSITSVPTICIGSVGTATATGSGGASPYTYNWTGGQTTQTATGLAAGNYSCIATDNNGCTQTQNVTITSVNQIIDVSMTSTPTNCIANTGTATATPTTGTAPYTYNWNGGQSSQTANGLGVSYDTCIVTDANGCTQIESIFVAETPPPVVTATVTKPIINPGESSQITGTGGVTYSWVSNQTNPVDAGMNCPTCATSQVSPFSTTTYCVHVTDSNGCVDSACVDVTVLCNDGLLDKLVPTAFSPNNDGTNDKLCLPRNNCIDYFLFKIFDRWGEKIFESDDVNNCWDGNYKGQDLSVAVFVYTLEAHLMSGEDIHLKGSISMIK